LIALYIIGGLLLLILLILFCPVYVSAVYRDTLTVKIRLFGFSVTVYSQEKQEEKKKTEKQDSSKKKKRKKKKKKTEEESDEKKKGKLSDFLTQFKENLKENSFHTTLTFFKDVAKLLKETLSRLIKALKIRYLEVEWRIGAEEPNDVAVNYGKLCSVFYPCLGMIQSRVPIKKEKIDITPDFLSAQSSAAFAITLRVMPGVLVGVAAKTGWKFLKLMNAFNSNKVEKPSTKLIEIQLNDNKKKKKLLKEEKRLQTKKKNQ